MKIVGINGSPRANWNSAEMLDSALRGAADAGAETVRYDLAQLDFTGCLSCFACKRIGGSGLGSCALKDDLTAILGEILEADAVIVSAPIYFGDVPGMVRSFFERLWFPSLLYQRDGASAYAKRVKVGLIYTMNVEDPAFYDDLIQQHLGTCQRFVGDTQVVCSAGTLQYDDYSKYAGDMFDPEARKLRHETVFPEDCKKAFELGKSLVG